MSAALALEKEMVVACDGVAGGESHFAARRQFGSSIRFSFHPGPEQVVKALRSGKADCGIIEGGNSCIDNYLKDSDLCILSKIESEHGPETTFLVLGKPQQVP